VNKSGIFKKFNSIKTITYLKMPMFTPHLQWLLWGGVNIQLIPKIASKCLKIAYFGIFDDDFFYNILLFNSFYMNGNY